MPHSREARPAHRPSRRHQLVEGAVELFAVKPPELVTIAEIVQQAGMTPAAFYYHFSSREELLQEIVDGFAEEWVARMEDAWGEARAAADVLDGAALLLDWARENRPRATIFFVTSKGATVAIEETRGLVGTRASALAAAAICRVTSRRAGPSTGLEGLSLTIVLDAALRAELSLDTTYRTLGPRRFWDEVSELCTRVMGVSSEAG